MLETDSPAMKALALQLMLEALQDGRDEELIAAGFKPHTVKRLVRLPLGDQLRAGRDEMRVLLAIDNDAMERCIDRIEREHAERDLKIYFAKHGATPTLMRELFKLDRAAFERLRRPFGSIGPGRTRMPKPGDRDTIHRAWSKIAAEETDPRMRYYSLHQAYPQYMIRELEAVLREFDE